MFDPFTVIFKNLHIGFRYLKSTFIFKRTQWLNVYLDQTGHAGCLSTPLPLLGSVAMWSCLHCSQTVGIIPNDCAKCKLFSPPPPHSIRGIMNYCCVENEDFDDIIKKIILCTANRCLLVSGKESKAWYVLFLLIFTTIQWGRCYSFVNSTIPY